MAPLTNRKTNPDKLESVKVRAVAAEADTKRATASRAETARRLAELGHQVAGLNRGLAEIAQRNAMGKTPRP